MPPKAFISYSWTSKEHTDRVREWAERLISSDGIDILLDQFDLKEGQDKYAYMEKMVTDSTVTHVLVLCDKRYAEKADARKAGVGTETQIMTPEIYEKVEQSKFIPVVCELDENSEPYLPTFLKSRIWLNFATLEAANANWERLVRLIYDKPLYVKPGVGRPPSYITEDTKAPSSPSAGKLNTFRQALLAGRTGLPMYRNDFLDACFEYADSLRVREQPILDSFPQKVLDDCGSLAKVRDHIVDWISLETGITSPEEFSETLIGFLERTLELKARPAIVTTWNDFWFDAHRFFVYELFLYVVAVLLKRGAFSVLHNVFSSSYLRPETEGYREDRFESFDAFYGSSSVFKSLLAPEGRTLMSPTAALVQRLATRVDTPFNAIMEAELLVFLMALINSDARWNPETLYYAQSVSSFPFFVRTAQRKGFRNLAIITGAEDAKKLVEEIKGGIARQNVSQWDMFRWGRSPLNLFNQDKWDTLK